MYPGWMVLGSSDPFGDPLAVYEEIINNARAHAYAGKEGLCWLYECNECDSALTATPGYPFDGVAADPAPWYDANDPDSNGFLGVIGLEVQGAENSTRQASVTMSLNGVGVIGPTYLGPRTLVVRALAIATDDCSLQYGLTWLRNQYHAELNPCGGDALTFFDCCPCLCSDAEEDGPMCWAQTYNDLGPGVPFCNPSFWPDTYTELETGPPTDDEWCTWPDDYNRLAVGPPTWTCCVEFCVAPYFRQYRNVRVTEGPTVLTRPTLHNRGAVCEIEFTIVCGDPNVVSLPVSSEVVTVTGGEPVIEEDALPVAASPYPTIRLASPVPPAPPVPTFAESWVRTTVPLRGFSDQILPSVRQRVRVRAQDDESGPVRVGLWAGDTRLAGYTIPYVAPHSAIVLDGTQSLAKFNGHYERLPSFVRDWDGRWPRELSDLPHGSYHLTIDQDATRPVRLLVDAETTARGAG